MDWLDLIKSIVQNFVWKMICSAYKWGFSDRLLNSASRFYYKRLIEASRLRIYCIKISIFLIAYYTMRKVGLFRTITKEQGEKILVCIITFLVVVLAAAFILESEKKKNSVQIA